jgi:hypothetical protein
MMTAVEIWGLEGGWKEIEKVHEMFCKRIRNNRQERKSCRENCKILERIVGNG